MAPTFYLEAQLDSQYDNGLSEASHELQKVFSDGLIENLMLNLDLCSSDVYGPCFPPYVNSIKAVHYTESDDVTIFHETKGCRIVINSYKMRDDDDGKIELEGDLSSTHPRLLPTTFLEDSWERLIFDCDIKESLVQLATNSLRFKSLNRLILLTGRPGTGKTTLAQALAQRLSIRLNGVFSETFLLHLRAAALLSQFFGQSAKQIHKIFESIADLSSTNSTTLYVLVIDEIESLAGSRSRANAQGEVQDAVRATNELLVGFDTIKNRRNVLIICTSNLLDSLDEAFTDRCSKKIVVPPPGAPAKYEILRYGLQMLVEDEIVRISEQDALPKYDDAIIKLEADYGTAGSRLRSLVDSLDKNGGSPVSARWLGQLPELALGTYLDPTATCSLSEAVDLMSRYAESQGLAKKEPRMIGTISTLKGAAGAAAGQLQKRKLDEDTNDEGTRALCFKRKSLAQATSLDELTSHAIADEIEKQVGATVKRLENVEKRLHEVEKRLLEQTETTAIKVLPKETGKDIREVEEMLPPKAIRMVVENLGGLQRSSRRQGKNARRPLDDIGLGSEKMLLDENLNVRVEQKKQRVGALVDKLDTVLRVGVEQDGG